jgi:hypothetical protein
LRSGSAHCDLEVAGGIWTARRRSRTRGWDLNCEEEEAEEMEKEDAEAEEENNSDKI